MALPKLDLPSSLSNKLKQGHPWVYRDQLRPAPDLPSGSWVRLRCGAFQAFGLWDREGPIAVRVYSQQTVPDRAWVRERVRQAWDLRAPIRAGQTDAYRWVYGEGDGLPAIVVDLYGDYAVVHRYSGSTEPLLPWLIEALAEQAPLRGIIERRTEEDSGVRVLWGAAPPRDLTVREHGLRFYANLFEGQKTGLFLDHRENRQFIEGWSKGLRVLNCFSYTGGFSLYAARGGADAITSCDIAAPATATARENFRLNGFNATAHEFLSEDVFELLERYGRQSRRFDLIILDPPSFARARKSRHAATRAYVRLNRLALQCLEPGGLLATASCTSQVSPDMFRDALAEAGGGAGRRLVILHDAGQPLDHPVAAGFPEGRYLKFIVARAYENR
jgi:23S rRNA (cytosine1962-C5)-methyltransferase